MKSALKYPGAKNRIAKWIVSFIPEHEVYLEPYAGSLAVLLNKERSHIETVNDLNNDVVNYFTVLRNNADELIQELELTPYARKEYNDSCVPCDTDTCIERARKFAVRCWQGFGCSNLYRNGFKSGQQSVSPNPARAWHNLSSYLPVISERLKGVQIENLEALELIDRYDTKDVFIYADPPYLTNTRKNYLYKHEMTEEQHVDLLNVLLKHKGKVLISGYDNDLYNKMLVGWHKEQKGTLGEGGVQRIETLWMNYEIQMSLF